MRKTCQICKHRELDKERWEAIGCSLVSENNPMKLNVFLMGLEGKCPYFSELENIR